jgi:hypothetical protein
MRAVQSVPWLVMHIRGSSVCRREIHAGEHLPGSCRHRPFLVVEHILDKVGLAVLNVDGSDQQVVRDVVQVATVLEPRTCHTDMICGTLALDLQQTSMFDCFD